MAKTPHPKQPSVAIFGSFHRSLDAVNAARKVFESHGIAVTTPPRGEPIDPRVGYVRFPTDDPDLSDAQIQERVFDLAAASTAIYVVCPDGYLGHTTAFEIGCTASWIPLYFSEMPNEPIVRDYYAKKGRILAAENLVELILSNAVTVAPQPPRHEKLLPVFRNNLVYLSKERFANESLAAD